MKRIFYTLIALFVTIVASAQERTIKVYEYDDKGNLISTPVFKSAKKVKVVFEENVLSVSGTTDGHDWVDLGLPSGILWATCNVGASKPEEYGDYFAWGEIEPKGQYDEYKWDTYKWCDGSATTITKYSDEVDNKKELDSEDDAATVKWGDNWCMPTIMQWDELLNPSNTEVEWTIVNGVSGQKVTSKKNGNILFLPATGYRHYRALDYVGSEGYYWSRDFRSEGGDSYAWQINFSSDAPVVTSDVPVSSYISSRHRYNGQSVRPVLVKK